MNLAMKKLKISIIFSSLITPSVAFAHGNPVFLYSLVGLAIFHLVLGGFFIFSRKTEGLRLPLFGLFFICTFFCWLWALNYKGPNFSAMFAGLIIGPLITFALLLWLVQKNIMKN